MPTDFDRRFETLTGTSPFPWQRALFARLVRGDIPRACAIPTGLGKTSVIAIWWIARETGAALPRRLVYVVNRRTVVDQTTFEVERLRAGLGQEALAVSTLRGQLADNREWSEDPSRPAVISGTVDMIGSRLLFSGYRIGYKTRPLHAGLLGQDSLIVHDEAHLEPAFQTLLETLAMEQHSAGDPWPMKVMALSATVRGGDEPFGLSDADRAHAEVARRLGAVKRLTLHACADKEVVPEIVEHVKSFAASGKAILVFVRTVDAVDRVIRDVEKAVPGRVLALTGTMRGFERDGLVQAPVFARFLPPSNRRGEVAEGTVVLVCTSAGEVGVNLSADHLVTDLSTFDAMAQRFGRVNRFGRSDDTEVHVIHPEVEVLDAAVEAGKAPDAAPMRATLDLLRELAGDASPAALERLPGDRRRAAFAPPPAILPTTSVLLDAWSMTTIRERLPGRPPVTEYLHGVAEWEPPTTQVGWREEVERITAPLLDQYPPEELLEDYPLKPHELLSDRTARIVDVLLDAPAALAKAPIWIIAPDGTVTVRELGTLSRDRKRLEPELADRILLLPPSNSSPIEGRFTSGSWLAGGDEVDVADEWRNEEGKPRRCRVDDGEEPPAGMRLIRSIHLVADEDADDSEEAKPRMWRWYEMPRGGDSDGPRAARRAVLLDVHNGDVERFAREFVGRLRLPVRLARAAVIAARLHDIGKRRRVWQRSIGNFVSVRYSAS